MRVLTSDAIPGGLQPEAPLDPTQEIPEAPPPSVRDRYLKVSWAYVYWCAGMLLWTILCVGYFIVTGQMLEMTIGICLGLLLLGITFFPATLFGGTTWYKRLGWITILTGLFSLMFAYPIVVVILGILRRWREGRYAPYPHFYDGWHLALSLMTVILAIWTILLSVRCWRLTRKLQRGDYVA